MNNKDKYGEVFTPDFFIEDMIWDAFYNMQSNFFYNFKNIFEPGAGKGQFFNILQNKNNCFKDNFKYTLNEINSDYIFDLSYVTHNFKNNTNIVINDIFNIQIEKPNSYDLVIGNLPFNYNAKKFVPGLAKNNKDNKLVTNSKSISIWTQITHLVFNQFLDIDGFFYCIIPCIWLKPDKAKIYDLFVLQNTIHFIKNFSCTEANKIFNYNCQTPMCYVLVQKKMNINHAFNQIKLYDKYNKTFIQFKLYNQLCIPTSEVFSIQSISSYLNNYKVNNAYSYLFKVSTLKPEIYNAKCFDFSKGGLENFDSTFFHNNDNNIKDKDKDNTYYKVITGSSFNTNLNSLTLNGFVSKNHGLFYGNTKLILPHKRKAKFFKDIDGSYSLYGRDMYVFLCDNEEQVNQLYDFFNIPFINNIIENGFKIRMSFIEKYIFQYIPWIFHSNFNMQQFVESCLI